MELWPSGGSGGVEAERGGARQVRGSRGWTARRVARNAVDEGAQRSAVVARCVCATRLCVARLARLGRLLLSACAHVTRVVCRCEVLRARDGD